MTLQSNTILLIAEHSQDTLKSSTYATLSAAQQLGNVIDILLIGHDCQSACEAARFLPNIRSVLYAEHPLFTHIIAESVTPFIINLAKNYQYIMAPATAFGKNVLPRIAALLDIAPISDVINIHSNDTFTRPIYAGNVLTTVQSHDVIKALTIRPTAFPSAIPTDIAAPIQTLSVQPEVTPTQFVKQTFNTATRPELATAPCVVAGGRALGSAENFQSLLGPLADQLNAAMGASRSAVDAGYAPNSYQIGQTGTVVAPNLYFALGIAGAVQHQAGMKASKVIVAVNLDPDAEIFQIADYGMVADIFDVIPELTQALAER